MPWRRNRHHRPERPQSWRRNLTLSLSPAPQDYAHQSLWKGKVGQEGDSQFMVQDVFGIDDPLHVLITSQVLNTAQTSLKSQTIFLKSPTDLNGVKG